MALGKATVNILANLKPLKRGLLEARVAVSSMVKRAGGLMKTGFTAGFRIITSGLRKITSLAKIAAVALLGIGIASVKIAADAEETANLFDVSMGSMADSANKWVAEYSQSLGLFEINTKKAVSTFQLMLTSMGFTEKAAFDMSKGLVELTNDIASLRNLSLDEAFTKVSAGLTGEAEPLKRIGILLNETTIKQLALKDATRDQTKELTELEKVQFRYQALLNATERDQGDFKRTIDSTSNVFKIIGEQINASANTIGKVFIPEVTAAAIAVRDWLKENQTLIADWATVVKGAIGSVVDRLKAYFKFAQKGPAGFEVIFKDLGRIFKGLFDSIKDAFKRLRPVAVEFGSAMAEGFIKAIEGTKLGKFFKSDRFVGAIAGARSALGPLGSPKSSLTGLGHGSGLNLLDRDTAFAGAGSGARGALPRTISAGLGIRGAITGSKELIELKLIRKAIEATSGQELDF